MKVEEVDASAGRVRVRNAYDFLDLSHLALEWRVLAGGVAVQSGTVAEPLDTEAGQSRELTLPYDAAQGPAGPRGDPGTEFQVARGTAVGAARPRGGVGAADAAEAGARGLRHRRPRRPL